MAVTFISIPTKARKSPWPKRAASGVLRCFAARRDGQSQHASPLKPELFWQIKESVRGLAEGCKAFNAPVTGGQLLALQSKPRRPD